MIPGDPGARAGRAGRPQPHDAAHVGLGRPRRRRSCCACTARTTTAGCSTSSRRGSPRSATTPSRSTSAATATAARSTPASRGRCSTSTSRCWSAHLGGGPVGLRRPLVRRRAGQRRGRRVPGARAVGREHRRARPAAGRAGPARPHPRRRPPVVRRAPTGRCSSRRRPWASVEEMAAYRRREQPAPARRSGRCTSRATAPARSEGGWVWKADPMFGIGVPSEFNVEMLEAEMRRVRCPVLVLTGDRAGHLAGAHPTRSSRARGAWLRRAPRGGGRHRPLRPPRGPRRDDAPHRGVPARGRAREPPRSCCTTSASRGRRRPVAGGGAARVGRRRPAGPRPHARARATAPTTRSARSRWPGGRSADAGAGRRRRPERARRADPRRRRRLRARWSIVDGLWGPWHEPRRRRSTRCTPRSADLLDDDGATVPAPGRPDSTPARATATACPCRDRSPRGSGAPSPCPVLAIETPASPTPAGGASRAPRLVRRPDHPASSSTPPSRPRSSLPWRPGSVADDVASWIAGREGSGRVDAMAIQKVLGIETEYGILVRGRRVEPDRRVLGADQRLRARAGPRRAPPPAPTRVGWDFEDEHPGNDARGLQRRGADAARGRDAPRQRGAHQRRPLLRRPRPPRAVHARVRRPALDRRVRPGRRADPAAVDGGGHRGRCPRARRSSSTRTTPTARATATAATRTTSWTGPCRSVAIVTHVMPHFITRQIFTGAGKVGTEATGAHRASTCRSSSRSAPTSSRRRSASRPRSSARSSTPATSPTPTRRSTAAST